MNNNRDGSNAPQESLSNPQFSRASWIFGSIFIVFLMGVFIFSPDSIPVFKQRLLAIFCALLAGLMGFFVTGDLSVHARSLNSCFGKIKVKAAGGMAMFFFVLVWWLSPLAPVASNEITRKLDEITVSQKEYENRLVRRVQEVTKRLTIAHFKDKQILVREKVTLEKKLHNIKASYRDYLTQLKQQIKRLEKLTDTFSPIILKQALLALRKGDESKALALFKKVVTSGENTIRAIAESNYQQGLIARRKIRYRLAYEKFVRAIELQPKNLVYLDDVGTACYKFGEYNKAIVYYEKALKLKYKIYGDKHSSIATTYNNLGAAWTAKGNYGKAIAFYEKGLDI